MKKFFAIVFAVISIGWGLIMTLGYIVKLNEGLSDKDETLFLITVSIVGWLPMLLGFMVVYWLLRSRRAKLSATTTVQSFTPQSSVAQVPNTAVNIAYQKKEINSQNYYD